MPTAAVERLARRRMSFEEYLSLPEGSRAEYADGAAIMSPPARRGHNLVGQRLAALLKDALPAYDVAWEAGIVTGPQRRRIPDVAVFHEFEDVVFSETPPFLVVEVLSPSTRSEDTLRKPHEYLHAGVVHLWIVDREARTLTALSADGEAWDILLELSEEQPVGEVPLGEYGAVTVDLGALLEPPGR